MEGITLPRLLDDWEVKLQDLFMKLSQLSNCEKEDGAVYFYKSSLD